LVHGRSAEEGRDDKKYPVDVSVEEGGDVNVSKRKTHEHF